MTIGNSINKKIRIFPIPILQIFRFLYNCLWETANAISKIRYIRSTYITDQTKFIEHFRSCKQIGKILDIKNTQKRPQAQQPIFLGLESEKSGNQVPHFENLETIWNLLTKFLCRMDHTLSQTSSRGTKIKQNRFGWKFKNTVKMQS